VLITLGVGLLVAGNNGCWTGCGLRRTPAQPGMLARNIIVQLLFRLLAYIGSFNHITILPSVHSYSGARGDRGRWPRAAPSLAEY